MNSLRHRIGEHVASLPRTFWILWLGMLVNRLGTFVLPFMALYLTQERGLSVEAAGVDVSLYGLGSLVTGPLGGALADRLGRRPMMIFGLSASAAAMVHLYLARGPVHTAAAALLLGLVADLYRPGMSASVADLVRETTRPRAYALIYWAINFGTAVGLALAGLLAAGGFLWLFLGDAGTSLLFAGLVWLSVPETRPERPPGASHTAPPWAPVGDPPFATFCALSFLLAMVFMQHVITLPLDMAAHGIARSTFGLLIALNGALVALLQPVVSEWLKRQRRSRVLAAGTALVGLGFGLTGWVHTVPWYAGSVVLWTLGEMCTLPLGPAVVADLAPVHARGAYQGLYQMAWGAAWLLAPLSGTSVLSHAGGRALWGACLLVGLAVSLGHLAAASPRQRRLDLLRGASTLTE